MLRLLKLSGVSGFSSADKMGSHYMLHMAVNATEFGLMFKTDRHRYIERYSNFNKRSIFLILLNYFLRSEAAFKILTIRHEKELKVAYNLV